MKPLGECRLYAFVDMASLPGRAPKRIAEELCRGGADLIQLRAKRIPSDELLRLAEEILPVTRAAGIGLVINDSVEVAGRAGAPLVHLGQEDFFGAGYQHRSQIIGERPIQLGLSTHAPDQAMRAMQAAADYIAIGPVFPTATKPGVPAVTLSYVRWAAAHVSIPWFAIGGITLQNVEEVLAAGARRICVVSGILHAPDIAKACQEFRQALLSVAI